MTYVMTGSDTMHWLLCYKNDRINSTRHTKETEERMIEYGKGGCKNRKLSKTI